MEFSKRQLQVGSLIKEVMNGLFLKLNLNTIQGKLISICAVKVTPDLLEARVYISVMNVKDPTEFIALIEKKDWEIKKQLAAKLKHQLRRIPQLKYFADDTLDYVFKMEQIFDNIKKVQDA
ncbi:MAG: ribosome-binding factor A [Alphaproteobacteria bacterium]|nr:ribosome-binding factor A [Alphaproteobacteria bacterium]